MPASYRPSHRTRRTRRPLAAALALATACAGVWTGAGGTPAYAGPSSAGPSEVRFASFNASLSRSAEGALVADLSTPDDAQAANVAEIVQRVRPEVLLINEFDYFPDGRALRLFQDNYLLVPHNGAEPITYPYRYTAPSNTGVPSGLDLNNDGRVGGPEDAYGFGFFPGQYGMAVYSQHPIDTDEVRTFQQFLWKDMPGALLPDDPATPEPADWYTPAELEQVRLSSKSHWDVPIRINGRTVHFLVSHPTPPVFDGPEDRNGRRNHDEIRFWADYVDPSGAAYIYDDEGVHGGLHPRARFVIAGDQNSDPRDGDSVAGAIQQLLDAPRINDRRTPASAGAVEASREQGGANDEHRNPPRFDTADFADVPGPGNLRADYVLPSRSLPILGSGVFWPTSDDPLSRLTGTFDPSQGGFPSSDHRLVWIDVLVTGNPHRR